MILVYKKMTEAEIQKCADETLPRLEQWFRDNPKRRICNCQSFHRKMIKVRRGHVETDFAAAVDEAKKEASNP